MKKNNLTLAQNDIDEALNTIESLEKDLLDNKIPKEAVKEKFLFLSEKLQQLENILKDEGIID